MFWGSKIDETKADISQPGKAQISENGNRVTLDWNGWTIEKVYGFNYS